MLYKLLNQISARINSLDVKKEVPYMLRQIDNARPDFYQYLTQNAPNKKLADLVASAVAHGILATIKEIPSIVNEMVSRLKNRSTNPSLRCALAGVLVYLVQPRDLIPDDAPGGYGFVDDNAIARAGLIEYLNLLPKSSKDVEAERRRIQFAARIIPLQIVPSLQLAIDGMHITLQMLSVLPKPMLELTLQQMINKPLQLPAIQQPTGFTPTPSPSIGTGHWSGGAYFEGNNVIISGGPSLIDGELFIPD